MERNRRVAKAYVRSPTIMVGGGKEGFDGLRIGLEGFNNQIIFMHNNLYELKLFEAGACSSSSKDYSLLLLILKKIRYFLYSVFCKAL